MDAKWTPLIENMKKGSIVALSRLITWVENRETGWMDAMKEIYPDTGKARLIGITGSPGAGKSTLTNKMTRTLVDKGFKVGVIAVDPSSPFSGGAILGDRIRMNDITDLESVFVRSMATRGALGGLNQSARDVAKIMDAFGKDYILIETVGVGQDEVEVVKTADIVLVVCVPGQGDSIQAIKAGIMEIADIFVVNKADRDGADQLVMDIESMLELDEDLGKTKTPIIRTIAVKGEGVPELVDKTLEFIASLENRPRWNEERVRVELLGLVEKQIMDRIKKTWEKNGRLDKAVAAVLNLEKDPYSVVQEIMETIVVMSDA
jgi:LAO/AO transport system kinase